MTYDDDDGVSVNRYYVTVTHAERLLGYATHQRRISPSKLRSLEAEMLADRFKGDNAETVKLAGTWDDPERLLDGQHRLTAITHTGKPQYLWIAENVPDDTFTTIDRGKPRGFGNDLEVLDVMNARNAAAAVRLLYVWEEGDPRSRRAVPATVLMPYYETLDHTILEAAVRLGHRVSRELTGGSIAVLSAAYYRFKMIDALDADAFFDGLATGANLADNDPILQLRRLFTRWSSRHQGKGIEAAEILAYVVIAWNHMRAGHGISRLVYTARSEFPIPK